ncbi:MAG TPA: ABC-2 transporter permease [Verrucomicrobiota bacterium]|nr:ABC-2 transporter permease [Verrucomicrobiota bacterium]HNU51413.1 ABC-2 transporter permease [Verrucomicrobiota bacterium]
MRQFITIAGNAFMELVRQPVFLLLMTTSGVFGVFLAVVPYFGFGDDPKMVKDSVLAIMLLAGLVGAVLSASSSLAHEIRTGTALAVLSKPVSRTQFLIAKYCGVALALMILTYFNLISALLSSRMAYDAYGGTDTFALRIYGAAVVLAYGLAAFANYFLNRTFVSDAVAALVLLATLAFVAINAFDKEGKLQAYAQGIDWRLVPAAVLILFAIWTLAGVALLCSTRLEIIPTLAVCTAVFVLGLMSDFLFGARAERGEGWAAVAYAITPNWQLFWMADALEKQKTIPWSYVGRSLAYVAAYLGAALALALALFEDRELS